MNSTPIRLPRPWLALFALCIWAALLCAAPARAQLLGSAPPPAEIDVSFYRYGELVDAASMSRALAVLTLTPEEGWYAYANPPGSIGQPTVVTARIEPDGPDLVPLYPGGKATPDLFQPDKTVFVYDKTTPIFLPLPANAPPNRPGPENARLTGTLTGLFCTKETCLPARQSFELPLAGVVPAELPSLAQAGLGRVLAASAPAPGPAPESATEAPATAPSPAPEAIDSAPALPEFSPRFFQPGLEISGLFKAALFALAAGFILNLMPCVLPVVSLKLKGCLSMGEAAATEAGRSRFRRYNLFFALGILVYFLVLAGILAALGLAWGQIFQNPAVVLFLALLVFALSLSLFGVFDLPVVDLKAPPTADRCEANAFFTGVLATVLATPCSGPLLGGVLAWTLMQSAAVIAVVFAMIGLGMASPYLFMAAVPKLLPIFRQPGSWTLVIERVAAFFLAATTLYLLYVLPGRLVMPALAAMLAVAFAAWMWGGWTGPARSTAHRTTVRSLAAALAVAAYLFALVPAAPEAKWREFEPESFARLLGEQPVLAEFTADWCPNCKFLELTVLTDDNLSRWQKKYGLAFVRVDLTEKNPAAEALLEAMGSRSIPVTAVFPPGEASARPMVLRDIYTEGTLEAVLERALEP